MFERYMRILISKKESALLSQTNQRSVDCYIVDEGNLL